MKVTLLSKRCKISKNTENCLSILIFVSLLSFDKIKLNSITKDFFCNFVLKIPTFPGIIW